MALESPVVPAMEWPEQIQEITKRVGRQSQRWYVTPEGTFPSVTTILQVCGKPALVPWAAKRERSMVLEALGTFSAQFPGLKGLALAQGLERHLGDAQAHEKIKEEAGEIGTQAHEMVRWHVNGLMGVGRDDPPYLPPGSEIAYGAWQNWFESAGLEPVRSEQAVWDAELGYAGRIDNLYRRSDGKIGLVDTKVSKGIYDEYHLQAAAYCHAGRRWVPIEWAVITRLPKTKEDPGFEVRELGQMYNRTRSEEELMAGFLGAKALWDCLCR